MEWIKDLQGKTVGLDTAPLIYFIEENPNMVVTSTVTLLEVLVHPLRSNKSELAMEYRDILLNSKMITLEITNDIAEKAAQLRATHNIRTPDAIQISAAIKMGATSFLTNDVRLPEIPSMQILSLDALL